MTQLQKLFFVTGNEENGGFKMLPAIALSLLLLVFEGTILYILLSSLLQS